MDAKLTTLNLCLVLLACVALVDGQTASTTTSVDGYKVISLLRDLAVFNMPQYNFCHGISGLPS